MTMINQDSSIRSERPRRIGFRKSALTGSLILSLALAPAGFGLAGCEDLPGDEPEQGAAIGGVGGALAGAAMAGEDNRLAGALIGGLLGAGGGYLIGTQLDKKEDEARDAAQDARVDPAQPEDVADSDSADLDGDGFVTMDELIALEKAGLSDQEIISRLEATDQVFQISPQQRQQLSEAGLSDNVLDQLSEINRDLLTDYMDEENGRISQPRDTTD